MSWWRRATHASCGPGSGIDAHHAIAAKPSAVMPAPAPLQVKDLAELHSCEIVDATCQPFHANICYDETMRSYAGDGVGRAVCFAKKGQGPRECKNCDNSGPHIRNMSKTSKKWISRCIKREIITFCAEGRPNCDVRQVSPDAWPGSPPGRSVAGDSGRIESLVCAAASLATKNTIAASTGHPTPT